MKTPEILKQLRMEKGVKESTVADYLHFTKGTISHYETGRYQPSQESLVKFAEYYEVSTDYLLGRTNVRFNIDILNQPIAKNYTIGNFLNQITKISSKTLRTLIPKFLSEAKYLDSHQNKFQ